jgi:restriction system protein
MHSYRQTRRRRRRWRRNNATNHTPIILLALGFIIGAAVLSRYGALVSRLALVLAFGLLGTFAAVWGISFYIRYRRRKAKEERYRSVRQARDLGFFDPYDFEHFVAWVFRELGYKTVVTPEQGDHGIDVILKKDGKEYAVQVKRYAPSHWVGEEEVRDFYGSYTGSRFSGGFFVTSGTFSPPARAWARERSSLRLITGAELLRMVQKLEM